MIRDLLFTDDAVVAEHFQYLIYRFDNACKYLDSLSVSKKFVAQAITSTGIIIHNYQLEEFTYLVPTINSKLFSTKR